MRIAKITKGGGPANRPRVTSGARYHTRQVTAELLIVRQRWKLDTDDETAAGYSVLRPPLPLVEALSAAKFGLWLPAGGVLPV